MNEQEWLTSKNPARMLTGLTEDTLEPDWRPINVSDRKLRLFAQACEVSFYTTWQPRKWLSDLEASHPGSSPLRDAEHWAYEMTHHARPIRANLLREIIGNPFRPVTLVKSQRVEVDVWDGGPAGYKMECPWLTPAVLEMAQHAYESRDFAGLPALADALEEAGCDNEDLLRHLRGQEHCDDDTHNRGGGRYWCPKCGGTEGATEGWMDLRGPHVRGCWALDLLLGEE